MDKRMKIVGKVILASLLVISGYAAIRHAYAEQIDQALKQIGMLQTEYQIRLMAHDVFEWLAHGIYLGLKYLIDNPLVTFGVLSCICVIIWVFKGGVSEWWKL